MRRTRKERSAHKSEGVEKQDASNPDKLMDSTQEFMMLEEMVTGEGETKTKGEKKRIFDDDSEEEEEKIVWDQRAGVVEYVQRSPKSD